MFIIGVIVFLVTIIIAIVFVVFILKKMKQFTRHRYDKSDLVNIKNTQDLLPFKDIVLNRIDLGDFRYVAIIKVEPFNYIIRSPDGKNSFAKRLRQAFNSIQFRTQLFTHTKKMTTDKMLNNLEKTIQNTVQANPSLKNYADEYLDYMSVINVKNSDTGALRRIKDYYMVVPWEPSGEDNELDDRELEQLARQSLVERTEVVMSNLSQAGLKCRYLTTTEIISLLIDIYHRDAGNNAELIRNGSYLSSIVDGDNETLYASKETDLSSIIDAAMSQIELRILNNANIGQEVKDRGLKVYQLEKQIGDKLKRKN